MRLQSAFCLMIAVMAVIGFFIGQVGAFGLAGLFWKNGQLIIATLLTAPMTLLWVLMLTKWLNLCYHLPKSVILPFNIDKAFYKMLLIGVGGWGVFFVGGSLIGQWLDDDPMAMFVPLIAKNPILWTLAIAILAPIYEELLFRGVVLGVLLQSSMRPMLASLTTSTLFAMAHWQYDWLGMGLVFGLSMIFCWARMATHSLILPIILHCLNNALAVLLI